MLIAALRDRDAPKGDVIVVAYIQAAKRTFEYVPLIYSVAMYEVLSDFDVGITTKVCIGRSHGHADIRAISKSFDRS